MDSSIRSRRLTAIKGEVRQKRLLEPKDVAALLFEEARDLVSDKVLRAMCQSPRTGIKVKHGSITVPFRELKLPELVGVIDIVSTFLRFGDAHYVKNGVRSELWGVLLLGCDDEGYAQWFWSEVWDVTPPHGERLLASYNLTERGLALLMDPDFIEGQKLDMRTTYLAFAETLNRQGAYHQRLTNSFIMRYQRSTQRYENIRNMIGADEVTQ